MNDNGPVRYKVAEAARLAGVSASTLRLWKARVWWFPAAPKPVIGNIAPTTWRA